MVTAKKLITQYPTEHTSKHIITLLRTWSIYINKLLKILQHIIAIYNYIEKNMKIFV